MRPKDAERVANSVDPDRNAPGGYNIELLVQTMHTVWQTV